MENKGQLAREYLVRYLQAQANVNGHIIGAAVGSGMTAKYAVMGGADILLALSAGKYRVMGRSSYASYLCYMNNNELVMELGTRELLPIIQQVPVLFGLLASDPDIGLYEYLKSIKKAGFAGIVNFPTLALIDGKFREALEEEGSTYEKEVEAIQLAHSMNMFTMAFVTTESEAKRMLQAGADVICVHLGLTKGGFLGPKKNITLYEAKNRAEGIFQICEDQRPEALRMIYSGPANSPIDMQYIYKHTSCQGYIGGSAFDRIPAEKAILDTVRSFKEYCGDSRKTILEGSFKGRHSSHDYTEMVKKHIEENYMRDIQLEDLAMVAQISPGYLGARFKKDMGLSFTAYLVSYRMSKAKEFLSQSTHNCRMVAEAVGYYDYAQFSKIFKKYTGKSPREYANNSK